ncbi:MAG: DeoR/GlpR family DNA-binding transcription regulator, partial [Opitutales bacterium]|nr:DeoR/GlpR family DNA-binding transcription regulator [Opitutales bacterium]
TYSVEIAARAIRRDNLSVYIAGGAVRSSTASAVGDDTIRMIRSLQASRAFIGANGVGLQHGLMTPNYHEANVKRAIMEIAQVNILLLDSSKYERRSLARFGDLSQIGVLITDDGTPQTLRRSLESVVGELRIVST